jgi:GWxTD domain-containing protein
MKPRIFTFLLLILCVFDYASAQTGFIPLAVDYAIFKSSKDKSYIEIYLSFYQNNLQYLPEENHFVAEYVATAEILQNDSTLKRMVDRRNNTIDSLNQITITRKFLNIFTFELEQGDYIGKIAVQGLNSNKVGEFYFDFKIPYISLDSLSISGIELSSHIVSDTSRGEFNKNSFLVIPNPYNLYHIAMPVVYYYAEVYNLSYSPDNPGGYSVETSIRDMDGTAVKEYPVKKHKKPGTSAVVVGGYNIVTLPSANYVIDLSVTDESTGQRVSQSKRFQFLKPGEREVNRTDSLEIANRVARDISMYANFTEKELDKEFEMARYIADKNEKKIYSTLNTEGKRAFLAKFWRRFDPDPQTEINEFKQNYFERTNYANTNFSAAKKDGWKTDRGRVLLTYGSPSDIERNYMTINTKPYEIWQYHELEGGVIFVFADLRGFGEYELVHSTYSRELHQDNWENLIQRAETGVSSY